MPDLLSNGELAQTVAIYAALTYDIVSETCSSPQTAEINILAREDTLMKWVNLGLAQALAFGLLGAAMDKRRWPPLLGSGLAIAIIWAQYAHARASGLANADQPGTEQYA